MILSGVSNSDLTLKSAYLSPNLISKICVCVKNLKYQARNHLKLPRAMPSSKKCPEKSRVDILRELCQSEERIMLFLSGEMIL